MREAVYVENYVEGEAWVCGAHLRVPPHKRYRPEPGYLCDRCVAEAARDAAGKE